MTLALMFFASSTVTSFAHVCFADFGTLVGLSCLRSHHTFGVRLFLINVAIHASGRPHAPGGCKMQERKGYEGRRQCCAEGSFPFFFF